MSLACVYRLCAISQRIHQMRPCKGVQGGRRQAGRSWVGLCCDTVARSHLVFHTDQAVLFIWENAEAYLVLTPGRWVGGVLCTVGSATEVPQAAGPQLPLQICAEILVHV